MAKITRTPTRATGGITPAEKDAMDAHAKLWISRAMRTTPVDLEEITAAVHDLYAAAGLEKPRVALAPSPLVMAFAFGAATVIWGRNNATDLATDSATHSATHSATRSATDSATDLATRSATYLATASATDSATHSATRSATYLATYLATDSATHSAESGAASACRDLAGRAGLEAACQWMDAYQGGAYWAGYECYLTAMRDIIGLRLPEYEKYAAWERCAVAAPFRVLHPEFCIVSDFPEVLRVDDQNRPHCENGPSHRWRDGWALYHWHGVRIPAEWIEDKAALTAQTALTWANIEQRRAACEIVGWHRILSELKATSIDRHPDPQIGELVEVSLPDAGKERFLRVQCGTLREFALPVPKEMKSAIEAQAWTWGLKPSEFIKPEVRT
jgi:hypothetical protein